MIPDLPYTELFHAYLIGIPVWALLMSLMGERVDRGYIVSIFIWPIMAISIIGQIIRRIFV